MEIWSFAVIVLTCLVSASATEDRNRSVSYLITTPNRFMPGKPETICVELWNNEQRVNLTFELQEIWVSEEWESFPDGATNQTISTFNVTVSPDDVVKCITETIPDFMNKSVSGEPSYLLLKVRGESSGLGALESWSFEDEAKISILGKWYSSELMFIQTDKPIYRPEQSVHFRLLRLDTQLKPLKQNIDTVYVTDPNQARLEQWDDLNMDKGLNQLTFQLSGEPEIGVYTITAKAGEQEATTEFTIDEYVLPKYEVTIKPPKYITPQTERVKAKVCAKYTSGFPVKGVMEAILCLSGHPTCKGNDLICMLEVDAKADYEGSHKNNSCIALDKTLMNGYAMIDVSMEDAGWDLLKQYQFGLNLEINARVREQGTGIYVDAKKKIITFQQNDVKLEIQGQSQYKPGLPYYGQVSVKYLDKKPAANKNISIRVKDWGSSNIFMKNYLSDDDGMVYFSLPPLVDSIATFEIEALAQDYESLDEGHTAPTASLYVSVWYSPSSSFIQIKPLPGCLPCNSTANFRVQYTTNLAFKTELRYKVIGTTDIVSEGWFPLDIKLENPIRNHDPSDTWDKSIKDNCFYSDTGCRINSQAFEEEAATDDLENKERVIPKDEVLKQNIATHKGQFNLDVHVTTEMSDSALLVVYYVRPDGELVADSIKLSVQICSGNYVEMAFSKDEARPGEELELKLQTEFESICSYSVVDKSAFLAGGDNLLTLKAVADEVKLLALQEYTGSYYNREERCGDISSLPDDAQYGVHWSIPYKDTGDGLRAAALAVMTNLNTDTSPCLKKYHRKFERDFDELAVEELEAPSSTADLSVPANTLADGEITDTSSAENEATSLQTSSKDSNSGVSKLVRKYFPETWLWDLAYIDNNEATGQNELTIPVEAPDTLTQWIGHSVCMSETDGLGISQPAKLTVLQPFFVSMDLPYSAIRREKLPITVTVSNYQPECMAVVTRINSRRGYEIISKPIAVNCVCADDTNTNKFVVAMNEIGMVNISVSAEIIHSPAICPPGSPMTKRIGLSDAVVRSIVVEAEGVPREYTLSDFVCINQNMSNVTDDMVYQNYSLPLPLMNLVPNSQRGYVKVVGDIMGPALSNINNLIQMPHGCAEQIMVTFAPNIFILKYLEAIGRDEPEIKDLAIQYMRAGYMQELTNAHNDQSYSSFGTSHPEDPGSMWLTAFIVKCFGLAQPYIFIENDVQRKSLAFFMRYQDTDGCFPQIGTVHNKYMQGGFGQNTTNKAALTAFVAIAMMEAGADNLTESLSSAFDCIKKQRYTDAYTTSIVSYAYSLYDPNSEEAMEAYNMLLGMAKYEEELIFWKANEDEPEEPRISWWWYRPHSANTETTAYVLLTLLNMVDSDEEKLEDGLPIARWLSKQRNPQGGFGSTQDTVIGLQALARFAQLIYTDGVEASVSVAELSTDLQVASFEVNGGNSFIEFSQKLPRVTDLIMEAAGKGCFLIQMNILYNIDKADTDRQPFLTTVETFRQIKGTDNCSNRLLKICTRYVGEGGISNMAIISVKMVSGWDVDQVSLKQLMKDRDVQLAKFETDDDGTTHFYFEQLDYKEKCFVLNIHKVYEIDDTKPAVVTTYDYYKTELRQEVEYSIGTCNRLSLSLQPLSNIFKSPHFERKHTLNFEN